MTITLKRGLQKPNLPTSLAMCRDMGFSAAKTYDSRSVEFRAQEFIGEISSCSNTEAFSG